MAEQNNFFKEAIFCMNSQNEHKKLGNEKVVIECEDSKEEWAIYIEKWIS